MAREQAQKEHLEDLLVSFAIHDKTYKTVSNHPIELTVLAPTNLNSSERSIPRPVILRYHGGGFVTGCRYSWEWMARWTLQFALQHGAVLVVPDHRKMLEANGADMLSDLADVVKWMPNNLEQLVKPQGLRVDLGKTLVMGESAGAWCAVETGLFTGTGLAEFPGSEGPVKIKAMVSQFGGLNMKHPWLATKNADKPLEGAPQVPSDSLDSHIARIKSGEVPPVFTGAHIPARFEIVVCMMREGRALSLIGEAPELNPTEVLELVQGKKDFPPTFAYHGKDDTMMPADITAQWVDKAKATFGEGIAIKQTTPPGGHGVGGDLNRSEGWVKEGLDWLEAYWP